MSNEKKEIENITKITDMKKQVDKVEEKKVAIHKYIDDGKPPLEFDPTRYAGCSERVIELLKGIHDLSNEFDPGINKLAAALRPGFMAIFGNSNNKEVENTTKIMDQMTQENKNE